MKKNQIALLAVALGLWLIAIPLTFSYRGHFVGLSDIVSGFLLIIFGLFSLAPSRVWSGWALGLVGVWLQLAPLVFWAPDALMYVNDTFVGILAIVLSFCISKKNEVENQASIPAGWSYNPSAWSHRIPTVGLATLCWFFSRYMAAYQLGYIDVIWDPFFTNGTLSVITSKISKDFPVSDAGMGAVCYTLEMLLGWQGGTRRWASMPWLVISFAFLVVPVGIASIVLIILQPVVVGAWCSWCLATAASMLLMIVLTGGELAAALQCLKAASDRGESMWEVFWSGARVPSSRLALKPNSRAKGAQAWGVSSSWTLLATFILGIWLMFSHAVLGIEDGLSTINYILGPMIAAFSFIALSEVFRIVRFVNILLGTVLLIAPWIVIDASGIGIANSLFIGALVILFAFRRGRISERYGKWEKFII